MSPRAQEVEALLDRRCKLPFDERGQRRAAARAEWFASADQPLELHDILADLSAAAMSRPIALARAKCHFIGAG